MGYNFQTIEEKWKNYWLQNKTYQFVDELDKEKFYVLDMFPYPSGNGLHVGHIKGYLASDILARYKKMKGFCVLHPIGWDSFGLPAEQYAIKNKADPNDFVIKNIDVFRTQLKDLFFSFDFEIEINTSDPNYYKTTQWIFSKMYELGLAEIKDTFVNWCPELKTVLSNEEIVVIDDKKVSERGNYPVYAKKTKQWMLKITAFAEPLLNDLVDLHWDEKIKKIQSNWIGKTQKYKFCFSYKDNKYYLWLENIEDIFKLRSIFCHSFSSIAESLSLNEDELKDQQNLNIFLVNDLNNQKIPLLFLKDVDFRSEDLIPDIDENIQVNQELVNDLVSKTFIDKEITYKLKDWVFSRQRYWGEPFPIYYDSQKNIYLDKDLPVVLPKIKNFDIFNSHQPPLATNQEWVNFQGFTREINTMPNWAGSSWYYIAYLMRMPDGKYLDIDSPEAKKRIKRWLPVDIYIGGQEHANLHLLYARFWFKFLKKIGITDSKEPFLKLVNQGMILGDDGRKMSKSKGNFVNTQSIVKEFGGDVLRIGIAFMGPTSLSQKWDASSLNSLKKWLEKIYLFVKNLSDLEKVESQDKDLLLIEANLIKNVEFAISKFSVNVIVSELMIFFNSLVKLQKYSDSSIESFIQILSLCAPAIAEELWMEGLKKTKSVYLSSWPVIQNSCNTHTDIPVLINNKKVHIISVKNESSKDEAISLALSEEKVKSLIKGKNIEKIFFIPKKTVNIILK